MTKPIAVTDSSFEEEVLKAQLPVLVDFWAEWCVPCKMIAPMIDDLAQEYNSKIKFTKMDVDANPTVPMNYGIRGIPTLIIFRGGKPVAQVVGASPKAQLKKRLDSVLAEA